MNNEELIVQLGADISGLKKSMKDVGAEVNKATSGVSKSFGSVNGEVNSSTSKIKAALGGVGGVVVGAFAVDKVIDFGKEVVNSAATAAVVSAQFDTAFKGVLGEGNSMLEGLSSKFSIIPERLKPAMANFTAYFKGGGASAVEALSMTEKSMNLAANGAAYYDKSLEDVQGSLKSFMMGNFEAGDAIGVNTNKTKIAKAYNDKYKGSFDDLNESQQQNFLLEYVEGIYTLSGAMEQGQKEANGYENVLGNLKQAWANFMAVLGDPLLKVTISIMNTLVKVLTSATEGVKKLFDTLGAGGSFMDSIMNKFKALKDSISSLINMDDISSSNFGQIGEILGAILPHVIGLLLGGIPKLIQLGIQWIGSMAEGMGMSIPQLITSIVDLIAGFLVGLVEGIPALVDMGVEIIEGLITGITNAIPLFVEIITSIVQTLITTIATTLPKLLDAGVQIVTSILDGILSILPVWVEGITTLLSSIIGLIIKLLPEIIKSGQGIMQGLISGIQEALPKLLEAFIQIFKMVVKLITENLPMILDMGILLLNTIIDGLLSNLMFLVDAIVMIVEQLVEVIVDNLPMILDAGISILMALVDGIIKMLPKLLDTAITLLDKLAQIILDNLPKILDAGIEIILALIDGIIEILPELIDVAIKIIMTLITVLVDYLPKLIEAGIQIIFALIDGILVALPKLLSELPRIIVAIAEAFEGFDWETIGNNILIGLVNGILNTIGVLLDAVGQICSAIYDSMKNFFGIASPSKLMRDAIGKFIPKGLAIGIETTSDEPLDEMDDLNKKMISKFPNKAKLETTLKANVSTLPKLESTTQDTNTDSYKGRGDTIITGNTFYVREEADMKKIAKELHDLDQEEARLQGLLV